jgi:hypothetical protein
MSGLSVCSYVPFEATVHVPSTPERPRFARRTGFHQKIRPRPRLQNAVKHCLIRLVKLFGSRRPVAACSPRRLTPHPSTSILHSALSGNRPCSNPQQGRRHIAGLSARRLATRPSKSLRYPVARPPPLNRQSAKCRVPTSRRHPVRRFAAIKKSISAGAPSLRSVPRRFRLHRCRYTLASLGAPAIPVTSIPVHPRFARCPGGSGYINTGAPSLRSVPRRFRLHQCRCTLASLRCTGGSGYIDAGTPSLRSAPRRFRLHQCRSALASLGAPALHEVIWLPKACCRLFPSQAHSTSVNKPSPFRFIGKPSVQQSPTGSEAHCRPVRSQARYPSVKEPPLPCCPPATPKQAVGKMSRSGLPASPCPAFCSDKKIHRCRCTPASLRRPGGSGYINTGAPSLRFGAPAVPVTLMPVHPRFASAPRQFRLHQCRSALASLRRPGGSGYISAGAPPLRFGAPAVPVTSMPVHPRFASVHRRFRLH